jgi:WD40 repeat protein
MSGDNPFGMLDDQRGAGEQAANSADALLQAAQKYPAAHLSQDGRVLASERTPERLAIFDVSNRSVLATISSNKADVGLLRLQPQLRLLAGSTGKGGLQVWKIPQTDGFDQFQQRKLIEQSELVLLPGHSGGTLDAAFSPTRDELASVGADGFLRLWLPLADNSSRQLEDSGSGAPRLAAVSGNGQVAAAITRPGSLTVWNVDSGAAASFVVPNFQYTKLCLDQSGSLAVLGEQLGRLLLVGVDGTRPLEIQAFNEAVTDLRLTPDPPALTALSIAGKIKSLSLPYQPSSVLYRAQNIRGRLALSPDRSLVAFLSANRIIRIRDVDGRQQQAELTTSVDNVESLCFSGGGQVVVGGAGGEVEFLSESGVHSRFDIGSASVTALVAADDNSTAVLTADYGLTLIKSSAPRLISPSQPLEISAVALDSEKQFAVCCSPTGKLALLDINTSQVTAAWDSGLQDVTSVDLSVKSGIVVAGDSNGEIASWQIRAPENRGHLGQLKSAVTALRIVPGTGLVCAGSREGEVCTLPLNQPTTERTQVPLPATPTFLQAATHGSTGVLIAADKAFKFDVSTGQLSAVHEADIAVRAAISTDGSYTAVLRNDKRVHVLGPNNDTREFDKDTTSVHVVDLQFQPLANELRFLTSDGSVLAQPLIPSEWLTGRGLKSVITAAVSQDDENTAVALKDGSIVICRAGTPADADTRIQLPQPASLLAWLSPEKLVAVTASQTEFLLINVSTGVVSEPIAAPAPAVTALCSRTNRAEVWFVAGGQPGLLTESGGRLRVQNKQWKTPQTDQIAPLGQTLAMRCGDQLFLLSEDAAENPVALPEFSGIAGMAGSNDGTYLLLWDASGSLERFDGKTRTRFGQSRLAPISGCIASGGRNCVVWDDRGTAETFSLNQDLTARAGRQFSVDNPSTAWWLPNAAGAVFATVSGNVIIEPPTASILFKGDGTASDTLKISDDGKFLLLLGPEKGRCLSETGTFQFQFPTAGMKHFQLAADGSAVWMAAEDGVVRRVDAVGTLQRQLDGSICGLSADEGAGTLNIAIRDANSLTVLQLQTLEQSRNRSLKFEPIAAFPVGTGRIFAVNKQNQATVIPVQPAVEEMPPIQLHQKSCVSIIVHEGYIWSAGADGVIVRWPESGTNASQLLRHTKPLTSLFTSPNSRSLLAVDASGTILQLPEGSEAWSELLPGLGGRNRILFHEDPQGSLYFLEGRDIIRRDPSGLVVSFRTTQELRGACVTPDGNSLSALDVAGRVITIATPSVRTMFSKSSEFTALHRTASGLFAAVDREKISLFSPNGELKDSIPLNNRPAATSGCCSEANLIAVSGADGVVRLIDLRSRQTLKEFNCGRQPTLLRPDPKGERVLIGFGGNLLEEWDVVSGVRLRHLSGHESLVLATDYLHAGAGAVSADSSGEIRQWPDTNVRASELRIEQDAKAVLLAGDHTVALAGKDGRLRFAERGKEGVRPVEGFECIPESFVGAQASEVVAWLAQDPENHRFLWVGQDNMTSPFNMPISADATRPALSADGSIAAVVVRDGIDVINLKTRLTSRRRLSNVARILSLSPQRLIYIGRDGILRCLGSLQLAEAMVSSSAATAIAWNEKGDQLVTGADDGSIQIWSRSDETLKQVSQLTASSPIRQLLFFNERIFARSNSATIFTWSLKADGVPVAETPTEIVEAEPVDMICWDPSHEVLVAACRSGLGLWRVSADGSPPYKLRTHLGHDHAVTAAAVDTKAAMLISVDASGLVAVNPLPAGVDLRQTPDPVVMMSSRLDALNDAGNESNTGASSKSGSPLRVSAAEDRYRDYRLRQMQASDNPATPPTDDSADGLSSELIQSARLAGLLAAAARVDPSMSLADAEPDQLSGQSENSTPLVDSARQASLGMRFNEAEALMARLETEAAALAQGERSTSRSALLLELIQQIIKERKLLVDDIHQGAIEGFLAGHISSRFTEAEKEQLKRLLQQTADSRALQTLLTDFDLPEQWQGQAGSSIRVSRDGRTLVTLMPTTDEEERITGSRIDVWDVLSGVPLKRYEAASRLSDICLPRSESCVFSVPAVSAWPLFENRATAPLTRARSIEFLSLPNAELAVCAGVADPEKMRPLIELYDSTTFQPLQVRLPEGFNAGVRTIQKCSTSGQLAFCVTRNDGENVRRHELYVCSVADLSRFEEITPLDTIDCSRFEESNGGGGFAGLAFSLDGTRLATVAQTSTGSEGYVVRAYQLNSTRNPKPFEMRIPAEFEADQGVQRTAFISGTQRLLIHTSAGLFIGELKDSERKSGRQATSAIRFAADVSAVTLSDNSRWAVVGTKGGSLSVYDLASSTPEAAAAFPPGGAAAHDGAVISLNFSNPIAGIDLPLFLATVGRENRIKVWDCTSLESIVESASREFRKKSRK